MENATYTGALSALPGQDIRKLVDKPTKAGPWNVVCLGAHPDDPETGCGGTLAKLASQGHKVTVIYLTRGEAGIRAADQRTAATIRTAESLAACDLLKSRALFSNQIDAETVTDRHRCREFAELLAELEPDILFTHWPIDTHRDHRTAALLAYDAWQNSAEKFALVYYEVMTGIQTHHFQPNCFIDISSTWEQKQAAIYAHKSQGPGRFYPYHAEMEKRRGSEGEFDRAEAFFVVREKLPQPYFAVAV